MLTPQGRRLDQPVVEELAAAQAAAAVVRPVRRFDERIRQILQPDEISIGDFVLNGGEVAAMVVIDAVIRLVPGVLGDEDSSRQRFVFGPERLAGVCRSTRGRANIAA